MGRTIRMYTFYLAICLGLLAIASIATAEQSSAVKSDAETAAELELLVGDGTGVTDTYLAKSSTRLQSAIISLRLQGKLDEAIAYQAGTSNFLDAGLVNSSNQNILAYLYDHPELGWMGTGNGKFEPLADVSSQQLYKVLLEILGYRSNTDFDYANTESFAATKGFTQIAGTTTLTNAHIATALVEALSTETIEGESLLAALQSRGVIVATAKLSEGERISVRNDQKLGTYLTDSAGKTLYVFSKDAEDIDSCQGSCLDNWPIFSADQLQIPAFLNVGDFSDITRPDGKKQLTYKGWPLYYYVNDTDAGDVNGEGINGVWFTANADYKQMIGNSDEVDGTQESIVRTYQIDIRDYSFGTGPLTVEAGSKIVFTNYDDMQHDAVEVNGVFSIPLLSKGESHTITLAEPGTYDYYCTPHKQFMTGQIIVK